MHNEMIISILSRDFIASHPKTVRADASWSNLTVTHDAAGFIEWRVSLPMGGRFFLHVHMTSAVSRPCTLSINGVPQSGLVLGEITASWHSDKLSWFRYGPYEFQAGENSIRIDFSSCQPHLRELGLSPLESMQLQFPWRKIPDSGAVMAATQLRDGTLLGVGMDNLLYTRPTLSAPWTQIPGSGAVLAVTQIDDGTLLGIGLDHLLYTRATPTSPWAQVPGSGSVLAVTQLRNGSLLGVGMDGLLYTRASLASPWVQVPNSGSVLAVRELANRTLLGVGPDHMLYARETLTSPWVQIPGSGAVLHLAELRDGTLLGVGTDAQLYVAGRVPRPAAVADEKQPAEWAGRLRALEEKTSEQSLLIAALEANLAEFEHRSAALTQALTEKDAQLLDLGQRQALLQDTLQALLDDFNRKAATQARTATESDAAKTPLAPAEEERAAEIYSSAAGGDAGPEQKQELDQTLPRAGKRFRRGSLWR